MAIIFYGITGVGSILFSYFYMRKFWSNHRLDMLKQAETVDLDSLETMRKNDDH